MNAAPTPWTFLPIEPQALTPAQWEHVFALLEEREAETNPGDPLPERDLTRAFWLSPHPLWRQQRWLAYPSGKTGAAAAGLASLSYSAESSPDYEARRTTGMINLTVAMAYRRQGLGTALLGVVSAEARRRGMTTLQGDFQLESGRAFWLHMGAQVVSERHLNRLYVRDIDFAMLEDWRQAGQQRSPGMCLEIYPVSAEQPQGMPETLLESYCELYNRIASMTPDLESGELPIGQHTSPEDRRATEQVVREKDYVWVTVLARAADGRLAGLSELYYPRQQPYMLEQDLTGVLPAYRGRGLGKWLKAEITSLACRQFPQARFFQTGNNNANAPMLAINQRMGYIPHIKDALFKIGIPSLDE